MLEPSKDHHLKELLKSEAAEAHTLDREPFHGWAPNGQLMVLNRGVGAVPPISRSAVPVILGSKTTNHGVHVLE